MSTSNAQANNSLRPRTKRLISGLSDVGGEDSESPAVTPDRRPSPSPFDSRSASPIPAAHPQRASPRNNNGFDRYAGNSSWGRRAQVGQQRSVSSSASPFADLWGSSWTTLQGLANDFLGNDTADATLKDKQRPKKPSNKFPIPRIASIGTSPSQWGPAPTSNPASVIGTGTRAEREAAVRAEKKKQMLTGQDSSYADALGKFKRRLSDDHESMSAPPGDNDNRDALVYLHHVRKDDTMAGITIRYNCSANTIRKANRMWPNDTPQSRQTLILPVDACGVKGKPLPDAQALDLLSAEGEDLSAGHEEDAVLSPKPPLANGIGASHTRTRSTSTSTGRRTSTSVAASSIETEPQWQHDSWSLLPNNTVPTEIVRLSRRALGYFPPARRKSNSYSDLDTPSTSLDLQRASTQDTRLQSPTRADASQRPRRPRRLSNASTGYFPSYLSGPGGVGTMSHKIHSPGPGQDALNKRFAKLLPDVAPPKNQTDLYQPELPLYHDDLTPAGSGVQTPSYPHGHGAANLNLNLENVGGAIEGWVRRMATKARTPTERPAVRGPRASVGTPGKGTGGVGDLIEMTDEFEIGGEENEEERGRQVYLGDGIGSSGADYFGGAVGGGTSKGRGGGGKGGKND